MCVCVCLSVSVCVACLSSASINARERAPQQLQRPAPCNLNLIPLIHAMDECLKLLQGTNDEQRLVGLLLATKIVKGNDLHDVRRVFDAIGFPFLNRLLRTGTGQARASGGGEAVGRNDKEQQRAYLHLALSIISAFCRLPEFAAMDETICKVPILVETLSSKEDEVAVGDALECLLAIGAGSDAGRESLLQKNVLTTVVHRLNMASPNANWTPLAVRLILFMFTTTGVIQEAMMCSQELATMVPIVARQLVFQQGVFKFEALSLLHYLLASEYSAPIRLAIQNASLSSDWHANVRSGLGVILNNRVVAEKRQLALEVIEAIVEIIGEPWLLGPMVVPEDQKPVPLDRFFMLVVETLRIETAVLLNEVARKMFGSGGQTTQVAESAGKQQGLATYLALLEHIVNVVVEQQDASGRLKESTLEFAFAALTEVIGLILEFLEDAQDNDVTCGDLLLGVVRLLGRYLAENPIAHRHSVSKLLAFLLTVTREGQDGSYEAVCFMLPALSQITTELDGCKALVFCGGHKQIVQFVRVATETGGLDSRAPIIDACDTLLNLLIKQKDGLGSAIKVADFIPALPSLANWAVQGKQVMECALAASLCTMVLGLTNEEALSQYPGFGPVGLHTVFKLILMNLERCQRAERLEEPAEEEDLWDIIVTGCSQYMQRYPSFKNMIKDSAWLQRFLGKRPMTATMEEVTRNPSLQLLLTSIYTS